jgi:hypothetical protein
MLFLLERIPSYASSINFYISSIFSSQLDSAGKETSWLFSLKSPCHQFSCIPFLHICNFTFIRIIIQFMPTSFLASDSQNGVPKPQQEHHRRIYSKCKFFRLCKRPSESEIWNGKQSGFFVCLFVLSHPGKELHVFAFHGVPWCPIQQQTARAG